ncbi:MAG: ABC transporter substrate-binding protein [Gammaproteobacteria bacterium]
MTCWKNDAGSDAAGAWVWWPVAVKPASAVFLLLLFGSGFASSVNGQPDPRDWQSVLQEARQQTVFFNAWGGEARINNYLAWVSNEVEVRFGVDLRHVKLADTATSVSRILAEKQAGNTTAGTVDLLWVNGENFAALKTNGLLFGPWAEQIPNFALVNAERFPEVRQDFTVPVQGLESPWLRAQLVFYYDSAVIAQPPGSIPALLDWSRRHPGEFTYPKPPDFLGTTFLKQAILELRQNTAPLYAPVEQADFAAITQVLWDYLDQLHPTLLRRGRYFPANGAQLRRLMADGDTALAFSFSPGEAVTAIANRELPASVRSYVLDGGTLSNVSFLAIPFNARSKAAAMVVSNFLLSPEAQARATRSDQMGSFTALDLDRLPASAQALFEQIERSGAAPSQADLNRKLPEPHPSWVPALEAAWLQRYSVR